MDVGASQRQRMVDGSCSTPTDSVGGALLGAALTARSHGVLPAAIPSKLSAPKLYGRANETVSTRRYTVPLACGPDAPSQPPSPGKSSFHSSWGSGSTAEHARRIFCEDHASFVEEQTSLIESRDGSVATHCTSREDATSSSTRRPPLTTAHQWCSEPAMQADDMASPRRRRLGSAIASSLTVKGCDIYPVHKKTPTRDIGDTLSEASTQISTMASSVGSRSVMGFAMSESSWHSPSRNESFSPESIASSIAQGSTDRGKDVQATAASLRCSLIPRSATSLVELLPRRNLGEQPSGRVRVPQGAYTDMLKYLDGYVPPGAGESDTRRHVGSVLHAPSYS